MPWRLTRKLHRESGEYVKKEDRYDGLIKWYAQENNLDWLRIKAQIKQESAFVPTAQSKVGAKGLAQFMPGTWDEWGKGQDITNPEASIDAMCRYMARLLSISNGDYAAAQACYNWGMGNVRKARAKSATAWRAELPFETSHYLEQIERYYQEYKNDQAVRVAA